MEKLIRTIHPEAKVLSEKEGLVEYVASDETIDHYSEVIRASGWRFTHFAKNAPFCDSHCYESIDELLGRVEDARVDGKSLVETVRWAVDVPENTLAQLGFKMTAKGYLKAVSVGFYPTRMISRFGDDKTFQAALEELGLQDKGGMIDRIYLEQEQIELSACILGANPNALARAYRDGAVSDAEIAGVGFKTEEDRDLLIASGSGRMPSALRRAAGEEFLRIFKISVAGATGKENETKREPKASAMDAQQPDGASIARRRELGAWLAEFTKATR
jgi:hypothetical protein